MAPRCSTPKCAVNLSVPYELLRKIDAYAETGRYVSRTAAIVSIFESFFGREASPLPNALAITMSVAASPVPALPSTLPVVVPTATATPSLTSPLPILLPPLPEIVVVE